MKRFYETCVVFDGILPEEILGKEQSKIQALIQETDEFEKIDVWGRRELAYAIGKKKAGFYCLFLYAGEGTVVAKLEKYLRMNESVLRHLTVVRDPAVPLTRPGLSAVAAANGGKEPVDGPSSRMRDDDDDR